ncbi:Sodium/calcium exchanger protein-domain-containing protein [Ilyonectria sp. MPI-CAGE-AT-0026]|nr:Sodium/calcium exchanger protein-domain-containing protein [Ilyonectria sp. MPI-CAGE-AT-0026]
MDLGENDAYPGRVDASFSGHIRAMLFSSWLNSLLVFVPIGLVTYLMKMSPLLTFTSNAIAIVPLSALLTDATERIASDAGDTIGALLNITLGNLVELIIFIALVNNHIRIVQASILGSILVNLLLILGSALLASNLANYESILDEAESHLLAGLLFVSVFVILMPTAFDYTFYRPGTTNAATLSMSRVSALIVLVIYILYFAHEMRSRPEKEKSTPLQSLSPEGVNMSGTEMFPILRTQDPAFPPRTIRFSDRPTETTARSTTREVNGVEVGLDQLEDAFNENSRRKSGDISTRPGSAHQYFRSRRHSRSFSHSSSRGFHSRESSLGGGGGGGGVAAAGRTTLQTILDSPNPHQLVHELPRPSNKGERMASVSVLIFTSIVMSMCAEFLVSTIDDVTHEGGLSESVIGLIILPVVGNIAEYVTVVTVAARNKLDLAIAVAVGSAIQIALCVTPLTVIAGWIMHRNLELTFNFFETMTLVGTVLLVILLVLNDKSSSARTSGLKGALMVACYGIIGLGAYLSPPTKD